MGATSAQVDSAGFGSGPSRTGMSDVGREQRQQADPALQRGQATKRTSEGSIVGPGRLRYQTARAWQRLCCEPAIASLRW